MARVLYFSRDYTTHDHRFLSALAQSEHDIYYLRLERSGYTYEDRPIPPQIEQVHWAGGEGSANLSQGPRLLSSLKAVIHRIKPDLIQAGPLQRSAFLVALSGFRPLVSTSWGYDLIQDAHRNRLWGWVTRFTLKRSAVMVGDCDTIRSLAVSFGMPDERIVTFPWGVDLDRFSPAGADSRSMRSESSGDILPLTLLSTRAWEPVYGVDVIARAFVVAAQQHPELRLVMLGNGSQAAQLRQIFTQGGVLEQVLFPGQVKQADLPRFYRNADLYISASHSDGTSISLLEALACGCPALVSDISGNREWVTQGVQGWLFPDGDADALARAILQALVNREQLIELGRNARRLAEQRADWKQNFPHLLRAYSLALDQA